jgi:hypothetical protein
LAPEISATFSGTRWEVLHAGHGAVAFRCLGTIDGPRLLDGRTISATVGLAPTMDAQYSGTRWEVIRY